MGYMFLGEVVSKVSGVPYEEYVRNEILLPKANLTLLMESFLKVMQLV